MRVRVLGPVAVYDGTAWQRLGGTKLGAVLSRLTAAQGGVVSVDQLIADTWGDRAPRSATTQIHGYVLRLRRMLDDREGRLLATVPPGYRLDLTADDVDAAAFRVLAERGTRGCAAAITSRPPGCSPRPSTCGTAHRRTTTCPRGTPSVPRSTSSPRCD
ncbi:AfsR/SARP family transcriptional regulator [Luteipulveratus halotolerans]|uniref:AfsR/SARP family transcriptional regulator n=1 Tax=Luteipulveratus halotolerans TaxID=1631356 RepID=UPI00068342B9|nr:winged helix-turn-helix domain-containing protein [Luteipulveratus halotolerans]